jgi:hypothetical protein
MFFNIPLPHIFDFNFGQNVRQRYESRFEHNFGQDFRNSVLLEPLETGLANLQDIRARMETRIEKEVASGTDMTDAIKLLDTADQALSNAAKMVAIATSTVSGTDPHPAYIESQTAYVALNQAKDALDVTLDSIIKNVDSKNKKASSNK